MPVIPTSRLLSVTALASMLMLVPVAGVAQEMSPGPPASPAPATSPMPAVSPVGAWVVVAFDAWERGLIDPLPNSRLTLTLLEDGDLEGETGCGRYVGGWSREGDELFMGVAPTGNPGCGERRAAEDIGLSTALAAVASWQATDTGVVLLDGSGATRVVLHAIAVGDPVGTWDVQRYRRPNGELVEPLPGSPMALTLGADGTVEGSTGCRLLFGEYRSDGAGLTLGPLETEGLPCDDDRDRAERQLLRALGEVVYWRQDGEALTLSDGFDELLVELDRAPEPVG